MSSDEEVPHCVETARSSVPVKLADGGNRMITAQVVTSTTSSTAVVLQHVVTAVLQKPPSQLAGTNRSTQHETGCIIGSCTHHSDHKLESRTHQSNHKLADKHIH